MKLGVTTTNGNRKISTKVFAGVAHAVECACCCYLEVRSVTASLSHVGYLPFTCEDEDPPDTDTRYLKYRASGDGYLEACGVAPQHQNVTQEWTVDPFTGLTCYNGPESDIVSSGCDELQNCSATQKSYSCAFEGDPNNPCRGGPHSWEESLQDSYTIEDVASNVDTVLGRINPYGNDGMPAGTRGSVINGTNGSILTWVNDCALNRAEYTSGSGGVTKTKLFVKFTKATQYTLTQSNGSVQTLTATVGQEITVDPPSEPNTWTNIAIVNKTKVGCCNSSIGATTHTGQTTDSTFQVDYSQETWPPTPFTGPDCKKYLTIHTTTSNTSNGTGSSTGTETWLGGSNTQISSDYVFSENNQQSGTLNAGQAPTSSTTNSYQSTRNSSVESQTYVTGSDEAGTPYKSNEYSYSATCTSEYVSPNPATSQTEYTQQTTVFDEEGNSYPYPEYSVTYEQTGVCSNGGVIWGSVPSDLINCPNYDWDDVSEWVIGNATTTRDVSFSKNTTISTTVDSATITVTASKVGTTEIISSYSTGQDGEIYYSENSSQTHTATGQSSAVTTYSNPFYGPEHPGVWEEETETNESLCASRSESLTTKTSSNVAAAIELTFTAPVSETPVNYEHWFHYYTIEADNSEQGCPTSDVVAHNEKWTSVSSGGVLNLSRNINLSTPPKDHSICAQGLAFVTRVAS